jgi:hypothetical protein
VTDQHDTDRSADPTRKLDHRTGGRFPGNGMVEIVDGNTVWRFEREFLGSNWTCMFGAGCKGILASDATELNQGCCSLGAHFGDGPAGEAEAMTVSAYASMLHPDQFQYHEAAGDGADGIFGDGDRSHTRVIDGACIFLNRPGFPGGEGCALHIAAVASGDSPTEWKPSVCWQLPLRIDWQELDDESESATVRRWSRADWGDHGRTMYWCCTEQVDGGEAYSGAEPVVDSLRDELIALAGEPVYVELRRRLAP